MSIEGGEKKKERAFTLSAKNRAERGILQSEKTDRRRDIPKFLHVHRQGADDKRYGGRTSPPRA